MFKLFLPLSFVRMWLKWTVFCLTIFEVLSIDTKVFIESIEKNILVKLEKPTKTEALSLVKTINIYNRAFNDLLEMCKSRKVPKMLIVKNIYDNGGPKFLKTNLDYNYLRKECGWSELEINEVRNILGDTMILWENFRRFMKVHSDWFDSLVQPYPNNNSTL